MDAVWAKINSTKFTFTLPIFWMITLIIPEMNIIDVSHLI